MESLDVTPASLISGCQITEHVYVFEDTCKVYAVLNGAEAVLVDFGDGSVLDRLADVGVERVTDVLMTHHHRDQGQGLARAAAAGVRIWVPDAERDLFSRVDAHWEGREFFNNYNVRQDRFSLLEPVPIAGTLMDYAEHELGGRRFSVLPTPGHTPGSISLILEIDGQRLAFTGDLIAAPGRVWSLAATQWTYNGAEGAAASIASLVDLKRHSPDLILPSHGEIMSRPDRAVDELVSGLSRLLEVRGQYPWLLPRIEQPYIQVTPHLLLNQTSVANSYVLLSDSGKALFIDYGYDFTPGLAAGTDRASRRPWLYSLRALKQNYAVSRVDAVIPTHYHDDHVAGINLLRRVEGASVWAAENFAGVLANPARYDLPCLWREPIPVDHVLPLQTPIRWEEYELCLYPLPGHTRYAAAVGFSVDGKRMLATGDQYQGGAGHLLNYVYQNQFSARDYRQSAELYASLRPDLLLTGHWGPQELTSDYLDLLAAQGEALERIHGELLADEVQGFGTGGFAARIQPYQAWVAPGETAEFEVEVRNPYATESVMRLAMSVPAGWKVSNAEYTIQLQPGQTGRVKFEVSAPHQKSWRQARVAADLTINGQRLGQQAEAVLWFRGEE